MLAFLMADLLLTPLPLDGLSAVSLSSLGPCLYTVNHFGIVFPVVKLASVGLCAVGCTAI